MVAKNNDGKPTQVPGLILKNKEDKNQYLIPILNWLARFIPNLHITPQGLLIKKGKNDRLVWDGSFFTTLGSSLYQYDALS